MNMNQTLKFAAYVSDNAGRLCSYLEFWPEPIEFACVVHDGSEVNARLEDLCRKAGIACYHLDIVQRRGSSRQVSEFIRDRLKDHGVDYLFCFGSSILTDPLLAEYPCRIINFHPSILPAFPGLRAIDKCQQYGAFLYGNTAHFVEPQVDGGPIIMQSLYASGDFPGYDVVLDMQLPMLHQLMVWLTEGRIVCEGRRIRVADAKYLLDSFVPALEINIPARFARLWS